MRFRACQDIGKFSQSVKYAIFGILRCSDLLLGARYDPSTSVGVVRHGAASHHVAYAISRQAAARTKPQSFATDAHRKREEN